jgi:hypothetical protein
MASCLDVMVPATISALMWSASTSNRLGESSSQCELCTHSHTHTHAYTHIHVYAHVHIRIMQTHTYARTCTHTHTHIHTCTHILRFHWEGLIKELLVVVFFDVMHQNDCHTLVIVLRSASSAHHLQHISDWIVHIALCLAVKILSPLHYHQVGGKIDPPSQGAGGNKDLQNAECAIEKYLDNYVRTNTSKTCRDFCRHLEPHGAP